MLNENFIFFLPKKREPEVELTLKRMFYSNTRDVADYDAKNAWHVYWDTATVHDY